MRYAAGWQGAMRYAAGQPDAARPDKCLKGGRGLREYYA
jgi:hypothetical protein